MMAETQNQERMLKIPFFRLGSWIHPVYGLINGTQEMFNQMIKNFKDHTLGRPVFVRLGHDSGQSSTFGAAPAEAWAVELSQEGPILNALALPTNPAIVEAVQSKQYRFASAEYDPDYVDKETGEHKGAVLSAVALTNEPFLTKLPDTVVLAEQPTLFYLDYQEVQTMPETKPVDLNGILRKFTDVVTSVFKSAEDVKIDTQTFQGIALSDEQKRQLENLSKLEEDLNATKQQLADQVLRTRAAEVDRKLAELVAKGIPPVMTEKVRPLLLAQGSDTSVKLADGSEKPLAEALLDALEALPAEHRISLAQTGFQSSHKSGVTAKDLYGDVVPELKS